MGGRLKDYGETNFITGIRAFAAVGVMLVHAGGGSLRSFGEIGNSIASLGSAGVIIFFVISGFSVAKTYDESPSFSYYLTRRLWRILPLYYFWLLYMWGQKFSNTYWDPAFLYSSETYNLLMWLGLIHYVDMKVIGIIGVEWTLSVELFWYLVLPLVFALVRGRITALLAIPISFLIYRGLYNAAWHLPFAFNIPATDPGPAAFYTGPLAYVMSFTLGVSAYRLRTDGLQRYGDAAIGATIVVLVAYIWAPAIVLLDDRIDQLVLISCLTFVAIVFGSSQSRICRRVLSNKIAIFLGTISFGLYLCHMPVLYRLGAYGIPNFGPFANFAAALVLSVAISWVTYLVIERPANRLARWLAQRKPSQTRLEPVGSG